MTEIVKTSFAKRIIVGALAGAAATVPMTVLMLEWHRRLPNSEQYPLPPREIFDEIVEQADADKHLGESERVALSLAGHFAYGASCGAIYQTIIKRPTAANGAVYGVGVWTASYLGWLPAFKILRPATEHPLKRNALMIAAHVVWGSCLGEIGKRASETLLSNDN